MGPCAAVRGVLTVLATLVPLSYAALASYDPSPARGRTWWPPLISTLPFWVALTWEFVQHSTQPGPWAAGLTDSPAICIPDGTRRLDLVSALTALDERLPNRELIVVGSAFIAA